MAISRCAACLLLVLTTGCMKESPYVAPGVVHIDPTNYDETAMIPYRTLVPSDFKAEKAPREMEGKHVAAVTVAMIRATASTVSVKTSTVADSTFYVATVDSFCYEARMSQTDSWWNPKHKHMTTEQMLEHEQIHFALSELGARQANAEMDQIVARIRSTGKTEAEAVRLATKRFHQEHQRVQDAVTARNAQFDMETANGQRFERNHEWADRIERELEQTEPEF
jgi:hypothetical protein